MSSPYFLDEPAAISFSGGRTSGFMLHKILEAHGGTLPDYIKTVFANTGKEMPQTLDFVRDCGEKWGVDIVWLELGEYEQDGKWKSGSKKGKVRYKTTTKVVDYDNASRNGEPFEMLIRKRKYLPNVMVRSCTEELKVRRIRNYLSGLGFEDGWTQALGIRADEPRRVAKLHGKIDEGHEMYCPLYLAGVTKEDVHAFWKSSDFDLNLPSNNGVTDWGNCDLCFLKGSRKKMSIIRERPDLADWWIRMESGDDMTKGSARYFRNDQPSYETMKKIAEQQPGLFDGHEDESISCFCGD